MTLGRRYGLWMSFFNIITDGVVKRLFARIWVHLAYSDEPEYFEVFDGRIKVPEEFRHDQEFQNPEFYII